MPKARPDTLQKPNVTFERMTAKAAQKLGAALAEVDPWARYAYTPSALTSYLDTFEPDAPRFEIVVDRKLAGAIGVRRNWLRGPYLQFLGVLPAFQHRGIGSLALSWFENEAHAGRAQNLWVAASDFNTRALAFYERHGFSRVATLEDLIIEGGSEILLRKRLAMA
jgi:ribosomal protein S18 acetylase RimI-like enzyme